MIFNRQLGKRLSLIATGDIYPSRPYDNRDTDHDAEAPAREDVGGIVHAEIGSGIAENKHIEEHKQCQHPTFTHKRREQGIGQDGDGGAVGSVGGGEPEPAAVVQRAVRPLEDAQMLGQAGGVRGAQPVQQGLADARGDDIGERHGQHYEQHHLPRVPAITTEQQVDDQQIERDPRVGLRDGPEQPVQPRSMMPVDEHQELAIQFLHYVTE